MLSLFSGIGGFDLAFHAAGFRTLAFVENNPIKQIVLKSHWPEIPIYDDITTFDHSEFLKAFGSPDVITGGFPCQPFSLLGARMGVTDPRFLWFSIFKTVGALRPKFVVLENVPGLLSIGAPDAGLCGWDNRWRRLHNCFMEQSEEACLSVDSSWDERKRGTDHSMVAQNIRGKNLSIRAQIGESDSPLSGDQVGRVRTGSGVNSKESNSGAYSQKESGGNSDSTSSPYRISQSEWQSMLDYFSEKTGIGDSCEVESNEREGTSKTGMGDGSNNAGRVAGRIFRDMAALGYDGWWDVIPAAAFGAGHWRERLCIVFAYANHFQDRQRPDDDRADRPEGTPEQIRAGDRTPLSSDAQGVGKRIASDQIDAIAGGGRTRAESSGEGHQRTLPADSDNARLQGHTEDGAGSEGWSSPRRPVAAARLPDLRGRVTSPDWWHEAVTGIPVLVSGLPGRLVEAADLCIGDSVVPSAWVPIAQAIYSELQKEN